MKKIINKTNIINFFKSFYGLIVFYLVDIIITYIIINLKDADMLNNINYNILLIINDLTIVFILIYIYRKRLKKDFFDFDKNYKKYLSIGFSSWIAGLTIMSLSNYVIQQYFISSQPYNQQAVELVLFKMPLYSVFTMILIGPFMEEMIFRLGFHEYIKNKKLYYFISILIFAGVHVLNGIEQPIELIFFIPYGAMAFSFAYTLDKTNNIFTTTIIHTFHNLFAISVLSIANIIGV